MPTAVTRASVWWSSGSKRSRAGALPSAFKARFEINSRSKLHAGKPRAAEIDAGIDFDDGAASLGQRVHRPDRHLAVELVKQAHSGEARLGDLGGADRVIGARRFAAALRVQPRVALAEMHEVRLHPVGDPEIEMAAMHSFEEARRRRDPHHSNGDRHRPRILGRSRARRLAGQIFAALGDRRGEAEIEAEQGWRFRRGFEQPVRALRFGTRHGRVEPAPAPGRRPRRSQPRCPCAVFPLRRTSRLRQSARSATSLLLPRLHLRLGGGPVARALDHRADPLWIGAVEADQHGRPAFVMRASARRCRDRFPSASRPCRDRCATPNEVWSSWPV